LEGKECVVKVLNVVKEYDSIKALKGLTFEINQGEIFGLLGPNGAGKTTLIKILLGLTKRNSGEVKVFGYDPEERLIEVRARCGVVLEDTGLDTYLTARENLEMWAQLYGLAPDMASKRVEELLRWSGLENYRDIVVGKFSKGMKRKLDLCVGLLNLPALLVLDEPTSGLDVVARTEVWKLIEELKSRKISVLLTTHYLEEANQLCQRVCIINKGKVVAIGTPADLKVQLTGDMYVLRVRFKPGIRPDGLDLPLVPEIGELGAVFRGKPQQLWQIVAKLNVLFPDGIEEIVYSEPTLDDVFMVATREG
jgi:ABC-2 type transport system ATP-binding protein